MVFLSERSSRKLLNECFGVLERLAGAEAEEETEAEIDETETDAGTER